MTEATILKIQSYITTYEQLIEFLKETKITRLVDLAASLDSALVQFKQMLVDGVDSKTGREMIKGCRQGLRETPEVIACKAPEQSEKLIAEFEAKLGRKFSEF
ncbi:hypothetical protein [Methylomonas methanica]|uniref:Uncharacterized protein n=1 Tax=Methylomonas methanica (strain DSM 25384 / MC09) TaxID=857087 RepID=G0A3Y9_METMM|nr:hypothetical protein [Methylomonas methanica]AEG02761.1 hypothetical protein Metme_4418 [Methylomonas methanica MC09]